MAHNVAICFQIDRRGFIREGYWADLVLVDLNRPQTVERSNIRYKCGWSPFEGTTFSSSVTHTMVSGNLVYNGRQVIDTYTGKRMQFAR